MEYMVKWVDILVELQPQIVSMRFYHTWHTHFSPNYLEAPELSWLFTFMSHLLNKPRGINDLGVHTEVPLLRGEGRGRLHVDLGCHDTSEYYFS